MTIVDNAAVKQDVVDVVVSLGSIGENSKAVVYGIYFEATSRLLTGVEARPRRDDRRVELVAQ